MAVERLQKILSNAGVSSRRTAEEMILAGRVSVNGAPQKTLGARADPDVDDITVDGVPVHRERYRYFMLNKPAGVVSTASDDLERPTVLDLVPIGDIVLHPVGRLDMDSEGLLLITNDGHLTDLLTHPRNEVEKEYLVGIDGAISATDAQRLVRGVMSEGERLRARRLQPAMPPADAEDAARAEAWLLVVLTEGRKREIRRMLELVGRQVRLLRRIRVGPLLLGSLGIGAFRELTDDEVMALYEAAKPRPAPAGQRTAPPPGQSVRPPGARPPRRRPSR